MPEHAEVRLAEAAETSMSPRELLRSVGTIFATFGADTQDSGNLSYGVDTTAGKYFVKTSDPAAHAYLGHPARVELLRNAVRISATCLHPTRPRLINVIESPDGPMLVYEWVDGGLLRDPENRDRFRALPRSVAVAALTQIYELHRVLVHAGWIASDFYDGSLIYDFEARALHIVDLDSYHQGVFRNEMGRMFGSLRFMAPEEFELGRQINELTTVFTMGRTAFVLLADGSLEEAEFQGSTEVYRVLVQACRPDPADRFRSYDAFWDAWTKAIDGTPGAWNSSESDLGA